MEWVCIIFRQTHSMNWTEQRELRKGVESRPQVSAGLCFLWRTFERSHDFQNARILMILNHRQNDPKTGRQTVSHSISFQEKREACSYFYPIFIFSSWFTYIWCFPKSWGAPQKALRTFPCSEVPVLKVACGCLALRCEMSATQQKQWWFWQIVG